jgi:hypothetical protein
LVQIELTPEDQLKHNLLITLCFLAAVVVELMVVVEVVGVDF